MNYYFTHVLLRRQSEYSPAEFTEEMLRSLLAQNFFQTAIWLASPVFFNELKKEDFLFDRLKPKARVTLIRYFNRMCSRPTPFAMFASFSHTTWSENTEPGSLPNISDDTTRVHFLPDFRCLMQIPSNVLQPASKTTLYLPNPTIYGLAKSMRFIAPPDTKTKNFELQSFTSTSTIRKFLSFCAAGSSFEEMVTFLQTQSFAREEALVFIEKAISSSLILSVDLPNTTGEFYGNRLSRSAVQSTRSIAKPTILNTSESERILPELKYVPFTLKSDDPLLNPDNLSQRALPLPPNETGSPFYVISERINTQGPGTDLKEQLLQGLKALSLISPPPLNPHMETFKRRFRERFDRQEIPLLRALDPELGFGYGYDTTIAKVPLLENLSSPKKEESKSLYLTPANRLLMKLICSCPPGNIVTLLDEHLDALNDDHTSVFPPSMSLVFRKHDDLIQIEPAGTASAHALAARFAMLNSELLLNARTIASEEIRLNPEVLFAEITFNTGDKVANINVRPSIYAYEIPVLTNSLLPSTHQIPLSDLYLSLSPAGNTIFLRSKKLNRRIIPRLSSAYNHQNAALTCIRFLCDLQFQGLKSNFGLHLPSIFPGLDYYPRIQYKSCVLSPATWLLKKDQLNGLPSNLPRFFYVGEGDRQLLIDQESAFSMQLFHSYTATKKNSLLTEACVSADTGFPSAVQYIASLVKNGKTYTAFPPNSTFAPNRQTPRNFLPADTWISYKLYCNAASADNLLRNLIASFIKKLKAKRWLLSWFFIRYTDPEHHIRLRISYPEGTLEKIVSLFNACLKPYYNDGTIQNVCIVPYQRELERYGHKNINSVEQSFQASSEFVLACLAKYPPDDDQIFNIALETASNALNIFFDTNQINSLAYLLFNSLFRELNASKEIKRRLDLAYRKLQPPLNQSNHHSFFYTSPQLIRPMNEWFQILKNLREITNSNQASTEMLSFVSDLLHMHCNRLFSSDQKRMEMLIYYILWKKGGREPIL